MINEMRDLPSWLRKWGRLVEVLYKILAFILLSAAPFIGIFLVVKFLIFIFSEIL